MTTQTLADLLNERGRSGDAATRYRALLDSSTLSPVHYASVQRRLAQAQFNSGDLIESMVELLQAGDRLGGLMIPLQLFTRNHRLARQWVSMLTFFDRNRVTRAMFLAMGKSTVALMGALGRDGIANFEGSSEPHVGARAELCRVYTDLAAVAHYT